MTGNTVTQPPAEEWVKTRRKGALISAGLLLALVLGVFALTLFVIRSGSAS